MAPPQSSQRSPTYSFSSTNRKDFAATVDMVSKRLKLGDLSGAAILSVAIGIASVDIGSRSLSPIAVVKIHFHFFFTFSI